MTNILDIKPNLQAAYPAGSNQGQTCEKYFV